MKINDEILEKLKKILTLAGDRAVQMSYEAQNYGYGEGKKINLRQVGSSKSNAGSLKG